MKEDVVRCVIIQDGKVLALHNKPRGDGFYKTPIITLPGGRVDIGETGADALVRECREEIGITPEIFKWVGSKKDKITDRVIHIFTCYQYSGMLTNMEPDLVSEISFIPFDEDLVGEKERIWNFARVAAMPFSAERDRLLKQLM